MPFQEHSSPGTVAKVDFLPSLQIDMQLPLLQKHFFFKNHLRKAFLDLGPHRIQIMFLYWSRLQQRQHILTVLLARLPEKQTWNPRKEIWIDLEDCSSSKERIAEVVQSASRKQDLCRCTHFLIQTVETCWNLSDFYESLACQGNDVLLLLPAVLPEERISMQSSCVSAG